MQLTETWSYTENRKERPFFEMKNKPIIYKIFKDFTNNIEG